MKKILMVLVLFTATVFKAQDLYALEYTRFVVHDIIKDKQSPERTVKASAYFDVSHKNIYIISDSVKILDVIVLDTHQKGENMWYNCVDYKTMLIWDVYISKVGKEDILQAKSKELEFWLKQPLK